MPLNKRQRVILHFLSKETGYVDRTALMKWLFLFSRQFPTSTIRYDFVPYKYGPFSFEATQDMTHALSQYIERNERGIRILPAQRCHIKVALSGIIPAEVQAIEDIWSEFHAMPRKELLSFVYSEYPWYASCSEIVANQPLPLADLAIYTAGYEGRSVDAFFNLALEVGICGILDVRRNAYSHKYGFSGHSLKNITNKLGIEYDHIPELGIASELRKDLDSLDTEKRLFDDYAVSLHSAKEALAEAVTIIQKRPTILLCFEAESTRCHRGRLAPYLSSLTNYKVVHL